MKPHSGRKWIAAVMLVDPLAAFAAGLLEAPLPPLPSLTLIMRQWEGLQAQGEFGNRTAVPFGSRGRPGSVKVR